MSLFTICQWIQNSDIGTSIRESTYVFPLVEATHVLGLAVSVGTIAIVDLRLIGAVMTDEPVTDVIEQLQPLTLGGFLVMFLSGALLFWSEAARLYPSYSYRTKFVFIFLLGINALLFHFTTYKNVDQWNNDKLTPLRARMAGWIGITFWAVVIFMGRWTAYNLK
ncbi:MAG TPA: DUF6644 family protein [Bryobacteraceae bacterium]|jgi:hypothetical protein|nr:DUF6644 family protein [Bryobacteraceae bacterium]